MNSNELNADYFFSKLKTTKGFFVDVGANDGITGSMSYPLESSGWKGILVEPNPMLVERIKKIRKVPVYQKGILTFFIVDELKARWTFGRWELKRFFFKIVGKRFKSNYI